MIHWTDIKEATKDLLRSGPGFAMSSLRLAMARQGKRKYRLKEAGEITVRARNSDFKTFRQVYRDRDYDFPGKLVQQRVQSYYQAILDAGKTPVIIDGGANVGAATRWFAQKFDKAQVIAIEPVSESVEILRHNTADCPNVQIKEAALGGESGFVSVQQEGEAWAAKTVRDDQGMAIMTIEDIISEVPNAELFIVKIDIEGFESDLFASNTQWIDRTKIIFVEPHDWMLPGQHTSRTFQREMGKRDFEIFLRRENLIYIV